MRQRCQPLQWREVERTIGDGDAPFLDLLREAEAAGFLDRDPRGNEPTGADRKTKRGLLVFARDRVCSLLDSEAARRLVPAS